MPTARKPTEAPLGRLRNDQSGFSLNELLLVMLIVGILIAILIPTFLGARESTQRKSVITAATAYSQAITAFRTQNANFLPVPGNATQWPGNIINGPVDKNGRRYLSEIPTGVAHGQIGLCAAPATCQRRFGYIQYQRAADNSGFVLVVHAIDGGTVKPACAIAVGVPLPGGFKSCGS